MQKKSGEEKPAIDVEKVTKVLETASATLTQLSRLDPRIRAAAGVVAVACRVIRTIYLRKDPIEETHVAQSVIHAYNRLVETREKANSPLIKQVLTEQLDEYTHIIEHEKGTVLK